MFPLLTNDRTLSDAQVFEAHKRQPTIEKRFEQTKTVFEIAPVLLKNEGRIEALFFVYFLALLVQALIERELRRAMKREHCRAEPSVLHSRAAQSSSHFVDVEPEEARDVLDRVQGTRRGSVRFSQRRPRAKKVLSSPRNA